MAQCQVCRRSGANMKRCKNCNNSWCASCAREGKGHYLKTTSSNKCSYCGKLDRIEELK